MVGIVRMVGMVEDVSGYLSLLLIIVKLLCCPN